MDSRGLDVGKRVAFGLVLEPCIGDRHEKCHASLDDIGFPLVVDIFGTLCIRSTFKVHGIYRTRLNPFYLLYAASCKESDANSCRINF